MTPRIYIADLAEYNSGRLVGAWIDTAGKDAEDLQNEIGEILKPGNEEWAIHDHEGFGNLLGEYTGMVEVAALSEAIAEHGDALVVFMEHEDRGVDVENFEDAYCGSWPTFREFADNTFDELYLPDVPKSLLGYIDYEAFASDLSFDHFAVDDPSGGVFVFSSS